jgi:hypothetical protein
MHTRRSAMAVLGMLLLIGLLPGRVGAVDTAPPPALQPTMQALFEALTQLVPWSLEAQQVAAPERRKHVQAGSVCSPRTRVALRPIDRTCR